MTEILGQLEAATGDMDKLKHILGEHAAKTEKPEWSVQVNLRTQVLHFPDTALHFQFQRNATSPALPTTNDLE